MNAGKRYWLVGASEGLGAALARALAAEGVQLVLSARGADRLGALASELGGLAVPMDVTDAQDVAQAAEEVGPVDGVIYCVGQYDPMAAQDWDAERAVKIAEANYIGALRVLGHVVPAMTARDDGHVVLIGSLAGYAGLPGAIGYASSKGALMHLAEDISADLRGTGVRVQRINPGFIRTRLTQKNGFAMPQIMTPEEAASHVMQAMRSGRFSTAFPIPFAWVFTLGRFLPRALFQRLVSPSA